MNAFQYVEVIFELYCMLIINDVLCVYQYVEFELNYIDISIFIHVLSIFFYHEKSEIDYQLRLLVLHITT